MGFFKTAKPKQFEYRPRYYDQKKEELENRRKELDKTGEGATASFRSEIKRRWRFKDRKVNQRSKQMNTLVYLIILAILIYLIFFV
jgi:cytochrome c-type biogenesis protein CcmH/NrfG